MSPPPASPAITSRPHKRVLAAIGWPPFGVAASAMLLALYAGVEIAWPLGFVALVPWLLALHATRTWQGTLISALLMSVAFELAVFAWFAAAFGDYVGLGIFPSLLILAMLAPLLQPQILLFALVRHWAVRRHGASLAALAGAAAWVAGEWLVPKLLGDTLGHGLLPSTVLRQIADLGGSAGLTLLLLLINAALATAIGRWRLAARAAARPAALAIALIALAAGYGNWRLSVMHSLLAEPASSIRIGLIQSNITDYERLRREHGAYAVIRQVLDTHYTMSDYAVHQQGADALLWSETVYPTTFGTAKSEDGAALDQELLQFVNTIGVPLVFGTYDRDAAGEYNTAAFVEPGTGLLGHYRKTYPFPLTEIVPALIDGPLLRRALPWVGNWRAGDGARVFPLRAADGRSVEVLPLICLDDVHSALAIDGARLGAQAIIGLSNDSWFTRHRQGARLHLAVAAFRSIETRLPQVRVTSNGMSAIIDESGAVVAHTEMGQQAVLVGEIPIREPPTTLMVRWGDWVGKAGLAFLLYLALHRLWPARGDRRTAAPMVTPDTYVADVVLLTRPWRVATGLLRAAAGVGLAWLLLDMLLHDGPQVNSLKQIMRFGYAVVAPVIAGWSIQRFFAARARIAADLLVLEHSRQRIEIPLSAIVRLHAWLLPLPRSGVTLQLASGRRWTHGIALADPHALQQALGAAGSPVQWAGRRDQCRAEFAAQRTASRSRRLDHPLSKFFLFPLLPALPAFRLHQHIAFGGTFGEYYAYGLNAWLAGLAIWWVAWAIGLMLFAAGLRIAIEAVALGCALGWRRHAPDARYLLERLGRVIFYVGVPMWLMTRLLSN